MVYATVDGVLLEANTVVASNLNLINEQVHTHTYTRSLTTRILLMKTHWYKK
jgi:glycine cleavage system H lipoate-binding protein